MKAYKHQCSAKVQHPKLTLRDGTPAIPAKDEADPAEALINTLNNMSLIQPQDPSDNAQSSSPAAAFVSEPFQAFSLYPTLPSELRLKILSHSLPSPSTVRTNVHVLISDPSFGLYVTFSISRAGYTRSLSQFQGQERSQPS